MITIKLFSKAISANWRSCFSSKTVPVGLFGEQYITAFVLGVIAFSIAPISRANPSSSIVGTRTGFPEARII